MSNVEIVENLGASGEPPSWMRIYIIECRGRHKVGISNSPRKRLKSFACGNPFALNLRRVFTVTCCANSVEKRAHEILSEYRVDGRVEWFDCTLNDAVNAIKCAHDELAAKTHNNLFYVDGLGNARLEFHTQESRDKYLQARRYCHELA